MTTNSNPRVATRGSLAQLFVGLLVAFATNAGAIEAPSIAIEKFAFAPKEITVTPGTTIAWINHDETPHTIATPDKTFVSKAMDTNDRFEYTFTKEGDYGYFCTLHPFMTGVVHVRK
jgi:plastocyanin